MDARLPVHLGHPAPEARAATAAEPGGRLRHEEPEQQSTLKNLVVDWIQHNIEPRWLGTETSDCVAVLEPGQPFAAGRDELRRMLSGAERRQEVTIGVAIVGVVDGIRRPLSPYDASLTLPDENSVVLAERLPAGVRPELHADANNTDRDLGLRLRNGRPHDAPWWTMKLSGNHWHPMAGQTHVVQPDGELHPILLDPLGCPVMAVWVPSDGSMRWYLLPDGFDWNTVVDWLVHHAIPAYNPEAGRRHRTSVHVAPDFETPAEIHAREALAAMELRYANERADLEVRLVEAKRAADAVRDGLFFGTGDLLTAAVEQVLIDAGFSVVNLDKELGGTRSADLLATIGNDSVLVEVKSEGRRAKESLVGDLLRHLSTWPRLRSDMTVSGGALVVNHEHRTPPEQRSNEVYQRREFVEALDVPVVGTLRLFDWWKSANWQAIRNAVLGGEKTPVVPSTEPLDPSPNDQQRRRWRWRR